MNQKEQVFLNSCELLLEQFSTKHKGFIYFVWKKGKKHIQSLKYQCSDETTPMKETLSLSLKTYAFNGVLQKRYVTRFSYTQTHFSLFDSQGRQLQHIKLEVTQWKNEPTQRRLTMGSCNLRVKVKRKVALELQNFHRHSKTQIQQSSEQQDQQVGQTAKMQKKQELSIKEQLAKAKREIEDFDYITNKLKNDRNFYIAENQTLRNNLADIHDDYAQQIAKLKNHYDTRIQIRESIYEEEIQQLITTFNSNYEVNLALIQGLVEEKYEYENQIQNIKADHNHYAEQQQINFQTKIQELSKQIEEIQTEKEDYLTKISEKDNNIVDLEKLISELKQEIKELKTQLEQEIDDHRKDNEKWQKQFEEKQITIYKKDEEISTLKIMYDDKEVLLTSSNQRISSLLADIDDLNKRNIEKDQLHLQLQGQKNKLFLQLDQVNMRNHGLINQIEILKVTYDQQKEEDKIKFDDLMDRYNTLEETAHQNQMKRTDEIKEEHAKNMQMTQQNFNLNLKIQELQHEITLLQEEILMHKNELENHTNAYKAIEQELKKQTETFASQYRDTNEQIRELGLQNQALLHEISALKEEIIETQKRGELDVMAVRQEFDLNLQSKVRMYEDELECYKKQRQVDTENLANMRKEYEHQLSVLFEKQTEEHAEVQRFLQEQLQMKNKAYLELNEEIGLLRQTCEDLKLRAEIAQESRDELLNGGRRRFGGHPDDLQIQEIQEESEEEDSDEQNSDSSQSNKKKKKKNKDKKKNKKDDKKKKGKQKQKAKKKKKKQTSSESQSEPSEQSQSQEKVSQILADFQEEDSFDKHIKSLANAENNKKGGSEKMIPISSPPNEMDQVYNTKQPANTVVSIPVPEFVPEPTENENKGQQKREKQDSRDGKDKASSKEKKDKHDRSMSSKKKIKNKSSEDEKQEGSENSKVLKGKERVKELQKQIKQLKKELKDYERTEIQHLAQIEEQEEEIKNLNKEMDELIKKVRKSDPKLAKKMSSEIEEKRQEKSNSNKSIGEISSMRVPPMPRKQVQKMKTQNDYLKRTAEEKNRAISALQAEKNALLVRLQTVQNEKVEIQKKQASQQPVSQYDQGFRKSAMEFESKYMNEKEKTQEVKLQLNKLGYEKEQLENQAKKLKTKIEELDDFIKKNQPTPTQKQMQRELEEYNRQFLDMSKALNSAKLEKQAAEEELRLMKKRYSEIIRTSQEAQTKAANLERQAEDLRRKENKNRRDIEDYLEEIRKYKEQIKSLQTDMNSLNTVQSQSLYERKKVMDEIMKLEDALSNKEFQVVKLTKQIDRLKHKIQEGDDIKVNKRNELLQEKQRLDSLLIKAQKRIQELEDQDKLLKHRISLLEQENKKGMQERKYTYGEKLRFYVQEISNIKQIVEEYQNQNSRLKIQNSELYEHNQILKISFDKLQNKYEQLVQNQERLLQQLDAMHKDLDAGQQQINHLKLEIQANNITIANLRKEIDTERTVSKKKSDKLTAYEELNEKYLYEIKTLKIKLSQFETNLNENELLAQKHQMNTKTIEELEYELKVLQEEYNKVINTYTYKKEDVEQAMRELKEHQEKVKEEEITRVIEELDSTHSQKQASMEQEIIELFNENSKLRLNLQLKSDESTDLRIRITQLEQLPEKLLYIQKEKDHQEKSLYELSDQIKTLSEQLRRTESKLNDSIRNQEGKQTENVIITKKYEDLDRKYKELVESHNELKRQEKKLNDKLKQTHDEKTKIVQKLTNDVQHYQNKILSLQLQVSRLKETESTSSKEYVKKIKKLQEKIEQMGDTFKEHEETLESHYIGEIKKLEDSIHRLSDELEHKMQRIQELNEALIMLQQQNEDLVNELTSARTQMAEENQNYTNDVNSLRNQLRQAENLYDANIKHLEEEMSTLSRQLTVLRYNRQQSGSRLGGSAVQDSNTAAKRLQQKVRMRDKRIEELKSQILTMEESITKLMKKQTTTQNLSQAQIQKLRLNLANYQAELYELRKKYQSETQGLNEVIKTLKKDLIECKNKNQEKQLTLEEKELEMDSIKVELRTTKQLYIELQQELQKRKTHLNNQIEEESHLQAEIRLKTLKINELTEKLEETLTEKLKHQTEIKRKTHEIKKLQEKVNEIEINYRQISNNQEKKNIEIRTSKQYHKQAEDQKEKLLIQNKKLKNEMALWQKQNHQLKEQLEYNSKSLLDVQHRLENLKTTNNQYEQLARKYQDINSLIEAEYEVSLEDFIQKGLWDEKLNSKDRDIQILAEELEELRFLYDHKLLEVDELKKAKYELELKTQDNEFVYRQLDELRHLCSNLEVQKKDAVFRQEAMKLQLQTLIESEDRNNITQKLQTILNSYYDH